MAGLQHLFKNHFPYNINTFINTENKLTIITYLHLLKFAF